MSAAWIGIAGVLFALAGPVVNPAFADDPAQPAPRLPNVVVILADDMGLASLAAMNPDSGIETPRLDALAAQGMTFTDAHSGSAVCSPTRYGLLSGRYAWRTSMKAGIVDKWQPPLIDEARLTIADMARAQGLRTACIGKWHLGWNWPDAQGQPTTDPALIDYTQPITGGPLAHGFERAFGDDVPNWPPYLWIEDERALSLPTDQMPEDDANGVRAGPMTPGWDLTAVLPAITQRCVDSIAEWAEDDERFFLFFSMTSPHTPISPAEAFVGRSGKGPYADFLIETDWAVGQVLDALDTHGLADDTLVIFTADNGTSPKCDFEGLRAQGADLRAGWRGSKADLWEGGHRVPFVMRWPGVVEAGTTSDALIGLTDVMPTVAEALGVTLPDDAAEDGVSLAPVLRGGQLPEDARDLLVHHSSTGRFAVRSGRWKLIFSPGSGGWTAPRDAEARRQGLPEQQLYDMTADPGEQHNVVAQHPEVVAQLTAQLRACVESGRSTPASTATSTSTSTSATAAPPTDEPPPWWKQLPWPQP